MAPITTARLATCVVAATFVSAAAATLPTEALADDGPASVPATPVTAPSLDTGAVLAGEASAAVEGAISDALGATVQTADETTPTAAVTTPAPAVATPPPAAPVTDPAPSQAHAVPDTTSVSPDTAAGIATSPQTSTPAAAAAAQTSPSNVNVSVRIGSPGDNGAVTQVNVAAAVTSAASGTATAPVTTTPHPSTTSAAALPASQPLVGSPSGAQDDPETWTWQWNCLSRPDLSVISPTGSTTGFVPKNWTWIWNCGSNATQYQDASSSQYQPSNVNISVRISSPGNDGPVSQANIAVAAAVGPMVAAAAPGGSVAAVPVPAAVATLVSDVIPGMTSLPALAERVGPIWLGNDVSVPSIVETMDGIVDLRFGPALLVRAGAPGVGDRQLVFPGARRLSAPAIGRRSPIGSLGLGATTAEIASVVASAAGRSAESGAPASRVAKKQSPRWRAPLPQPIPATVPSGASFAPATGGGSSGNGIPIFLVLPFLAAMLDLARRVTLDRAALPSGYRSRMPDDPG
jgi:hypothetical protein